jgi:hypothetical protein
MVLLGKEESIMFHGNMMCIRASKHPKWWTALILIIHITAGPKRKINISILLTYMCLFYVLPYNDIVIRAFIISLEGTLTALAPIFK